MSSATVTPATFLRQPPAFPFCAGCGYRPYLEQLDRALVGLRLKPSKVAVVSDVGCIGASCEVLAAPHVVRAMTGRSTAFAAGLELADAILHDSALKTIVVVGDGGAMVGLQHILSAAQMNLDLTVLVANNSIVGFPGGPSSALSPAPATDEGAAAMVPTLDLCALVRQCGGGLVARLAATDETLPDVIAQAIEHPGFALIEVLVDCVVKGAGTAHAWAHLPLGCQRSDAARPDFGTAYRHTRMRPSAPGGASGTFLPRLSDKPVRRAWRWVIAGSVGEQVDWAASVLARGAAMTGSHVTLNHVGGPLPGVGVALSEVCIGRDPIGHPGADEPDVVVAVSPDAMVGLGERGVLARATGGCLLVLDDSLPSVKTDAVTIRAAFRTTCAPNRAAMAAVLVANRRQRSVANQALFAAIKIDRASEVSQYRKDLTGLLASLG